MVINWSQVHKKKNRGNKDRKMKIDTQKPFHCPGIKTKYKEKLNNKTDKTWKSLTKVIKETAKEERDRPHKTKNEENKKIIMIK